MIIGIDFDNTIVCYDNVFHKIALEKGLIPPELRRAKDEVRDHLRQCGKEDDWTEIQGHVYGDRIKEASSFPGAVSFLKECRQRKIPAHIVSHKTLYPFAGPKYDLHQAARGWLSDKGFFDQSGAGLSEQDVFFELTKAEKLRRIGALQCTHFIDDLPEFLKESEFPDGVMRILFDPNNNHSGNQAFCRARSWAEIVEIIFH